MRLVTAFFQTLSKSLVQSASPTNFDNIFYVKFETCQWPRRRRRRRRFGDKIYFDFLPSDEVVLLVFTLRSLSAREREKESLRRERYIEHV